jgi:hypothetical protein
MFKNPACFVFPAENACRPGDHFAVGERERLTRLLAYRPIAFSASALQQAALGISGAAWLLGMLVLLTAGLLAARGGAASGRRPPTPS